MSYPEVRYSGDRGEISTVYRPADTAPDLAMNTGTAERHYKAQKCTTWVPGRRRTVSSACTGGTGATQPSGPSAHFHKTISESFFILSGTVLLFDGGRWIDTTAGDFLYVPQSGVHAFRNTSGKPASLLLLFTLGAPREAYFEELAEIAASAVGSAMRSGPTFTRRTDEYERIPG